MKSLYQILFITIFCLSAIFMECYGKPCKKAFINGEVYTMNPALPWAETVVIEGNKFIYVGNKKDGEKFIDKNTEVFDLKGHMLLPGFIESHAHPIMASSLFLDMVILNHNLDREKLLAEIKKAITEKKDEKIITMMGFKASNFGNEGPKSSDLDKIENKRPVIILDYGGHSAWVNTKAMEIGGITKDTPDPIPGGHYYKRDKDGNPTGWLIESMAYMPVVQKLGLFSMDRIKAGTEKILPVFTSYGFTTVFEAGGAYEGFKVYRDLEKNNKLHIRISGCYIVNDPNLIPGAMDKLTALNKEYNSELIKIDTMKIIYDGTLEAKSCAMYNDFPGDTGNRGFELISPDMLGDFVKKIDDAGYNIHIHAIGNRAISDVLSAFEKLKKEKGFTPTRKTICHNQFFMKDTVARYKKLREVIAQTTPMWADQDENTLEMTGKEIYERQMLFNSLDKAGVCVTFGSDFPVSSGLDGLNPFNEIEVGHMRRDTGLPDKDFLPPESEKLSIDTLLRGYTINGAYQLGMEKEIGSIETGKLADMIVIEKNIFKQKPENIHNNHVIITVMDGNIVYKGM